MVRKTGNCYEMMVAEGMSLLEGTFAFVNGSSWFKSLSARLALAAMVVPRQICKTKAFNISADRADPSSKTTVVMSSLWKKKC